MSNRSSSVSSVYGTANAVSNRRFSQSVGDLTSGDLSVTRVRSHADQGPLTRTTSVPYLPTDRRNYVVRAIIRDDGHLDGPVMFGFINERNRVSEPLSAPLGRFNASQYGDLGSLSTLEVDNISLLHAMRKALVTQNKHSNLDPTNSELQKGKYARRHLSSADMMYICNANLLREISDHQLKDLVESLRNTFSGLTKTSKPGKIQAGKLLAKFLLETHLNQAAASGSKDLMSARKLAQKMLKGESSLPSVEQRFSLDWLTSLSPDEIRSLNLDQLYQAFQEDENGLVHLNSKQMVAFINAIEKECRQYQDAGVLYPQKLDELRAFLFNVISQNAPLSAQSLLEQYAIEQNISMTTAINGIKAIREVMLAIRAMKPAPDELDLCTLYPQEIVLLDAREILKISPADIAHLNHSQAFALSLAMNEQAGTILRYKGRYPVAEEHFQTLFEALRERVSDVLLYVHEPTISPYVEGANDLIQKIGQRLNITISTENTLLHPTIQGAIIKPHQFARMNFADLSAEQIQRLDLDAVLAMSDNDMWQWFTRIDMSAIVNCNDTDKVWFWMQAMRYLHHKSPNGASKLRIEIEKQAAWLRYAWINVMTELNEHFVDVAPKFADYLDTIFLVGHARQQVGLVDLIFLNTLSDPHHQIRRMSTNDLLSCYLGDFSRFSPQTVMDFTRAAWAKIKQNKTALNDPNSPEFSLYRRLCWIQQHWLLQRFSFLNTPNDEEVQAVNILNQAMQNCVAAMPTPALVERPLTDYLRGGSFTPEQPSSIPTYQQVIESPAQEQELVQQYSVSRQNLHALQFESMNLEQLLALETSIIGLESLENVEEAQAVARYARRLAGLVSFAEHAQVVQIENLATAIHHQFVRNQGVNSEIAHVSGVEVNQISNALSHIEFFVILHEVMRIEQIVGNESNILVRHFTRLTKLLPHLALYPEEKALLRAITNRVAQDFIVSDASTLDAATKGQLEQLLLSLNTRGESVLPESDAFSSSSRRQSFQSQPESDAFSRHQQSLSAQPESDAFSSSSRRQSFQSQPESDAFSWHRQSLPAQQENDMFSSSRRQSFQSQPESDAFSWRRQSLPAQQENDMFSSSRRQSLQSRPESDALSSRRQSILAQNLNQSSSQPIFFPYFDPIPFSVIRDLKKEEIKKFAITEFTDVEFDHKIEHKKDRETLLRIVKELRAKVTELDIAKDSEAIERAQDLVERLEYQITHNDLLVAKSGLSQRLHYAPWEKEFNKELHKLKDELDAKRWSITVTHPTRETLMSEELSAVNQISQEKLLARVPALRRLGYLSSSEQEHLMAYVQRLTDICKHPSSPLTPHQISEVKNLAFRFNRNYVQLKMLQEMDPFAEHLKVKLRNLVGVLDNLEPRRMGEDITNEGMAKLPRAVLPRAVSPRFSLAPSEINAQSRAVQLLTQQWQRIDGMPQQTERQKNAKSDALLDLVDSMIVERPNQGVDGRDLTKLLNQIYAKYDQNDLWITSLDRTFFERKEARFMNEDTRVKCSDSLAKIEAGDITECDRFLIMLQNMNLEVVELYPLALGSEVRDWVRDVVVRVNNIPLNKSVTNEWKQTAHHYLRRIFTAAPASFNKNDGVLDITAKDMSSVALNPTNGATLQQSPLAELKPVDTYAHYTANQLASLATVMQVHAETLSDPLSLQDLMGFIIRLIQLSPHFGEAGDRKQFRHVIAKMRSELHSKDWSTEVAHTAWLDAYEYHIDAADLLLQAQSLMLFKEEDAVDVTGRLAKMHSIKQSFATSLHVDSSVNDKVNKAIKGAMAHLYKTYDIEHLIDDDGKEWKEYVLNQMLQLDPETDTRLQFPPSARSSLSSLQSERFQAFASTQPAPVLDVDNVKTWNDAWTLQVAKEITERKGEWKNPLKNDAKREQLSGFVDRLRSCRLNNAKERKMVKTCYARLLRELHTKPLEKWVTPDFDQSWMNIYAIKLEKGMIEIKDLMERAGDKKGFLAGLRQKISTPRATSLVTNEINSGYLTYQMIESRMDPFAEYSTAELIDYADDITHNDKERQLPSEANQTIFLKLFSKLNDNFSLNADVDIDKESMKKLNRSLARLEKDLKEKRWEKFAIIGIDQAWLADYGLELTNLRNKLDLISGKSDKKGASWFANLRIFGRSKSTPGLKKDKAGDDVGSSFKRKLFGRSKKKLGAESTAVGARTGSHSPLMPPSVSEQGSSRSPSQTSLVRRLEDHNDPRVHGASADRANPKLRWTENPNYISMDSDEL